ncbi:HEXXH motif domain-containing protein [Herbidospora daliensis]|uniref:HEXXH motif domain-containing protein n=1 Tax=Herbidospora daliensis TaxID=295585 RepID=UPI0007863EB5|nr:HEXXH motif domain-containing protein [Herbidospora daliensis]
MRLLAAAERSRHLLLVRSVIIAARRTGHERLWELAEAYDLLAGLHEDHPEAVERVLCYPTVGTWAMRVLRALVSKTGGGPVALAYLPGMALAAAVIAGADAELDVSVPSGRVVLPTLGVARLASAPRGSVGRVTVRTGTTGGEITGFGGATSIPRSPDQYAESWTGVRRLTTCHHDRVLDVYLDDVDPFRIPEGWPAPRRRTHVVERWQEVLEEAWALLVDHHPLYAEEVGAGVRMITPTHPPRGRTVSSTSRYAFGEFAGSLPSDGRILASLLAHEIQHAKLWALLGLVSLAEPPKTVDPLLLYAAWRDDPRPPVALLHGAYAHLAVAAFWRVQRLLDEGQAAQRAHVEYARWRRHTRQAIETLLESGSLTEVGVSFVTGMAAALARWQSDDIPLSADREASRASAEHLRAWQDRNAR